MKKIGVIYLILGLLFPVIANAQNSIDVIGDNLSYQVISKELQKIDKTLKGNQITSEDVKQDIGYISSIRPLLEARRKDIESQIGFIEKRIEALGTTEDDQEEARVIAQKRQEFNAEMVTERARISEIDILLAKMDEIEISIFNLRNQELWGNLLKPATPIFYPTNFIKSNTELVKLGFDIVKSPVSWYQELTQAQKQTLKSRGIPVTIMVLLVAALGFWLRRFILNRFGYRDEIEMPRYGRKVMAAFAVLVAYGIIPTFLVGAGLFWIMSGKILTEGFFGIVLHNLLYYSLYMIMAWATCRVIFVPNNEKWRLINMPTDKAKRVTRALTLSIFVIGLTAYLQKIVTLGNYPIELLSYLKAVSAIIKVFCVIWVAGRLLWSSEAAAEAYASDAEPEEGDVEDNRDSNVFGITFVLLMLALGITGIALSGYAYLASYIIDNVILSVLVIFGFWVLRKITYEFIHRLLLLGFWFKAFRMRRQLIRKLDIWTSFVVEPLFIIGMTFSVLVLWGVPAGMLTTILYKAFTGFTVGGIKISLLAIILGIVVFFVSIAIVKSLRKRLETSLLSKVDMDEGTKHSLAAGFSSLGYVASALLAIAIMGGNLTNFALVAGALSVGIGLGLQNVVNNFVSGIILLFERPIKVGDWVIINGEEGKIKQINIRSTEVETFNRASVIIPNATLLSTSVTNLTHGNNWTRFKVPVGVVYGTDPQKVKDVLMEVALAHKLVLKKPAPYVVFQNFGANGMEFELRGYSNNIWEGWVIPSDLRFEINRRFAEECIQISINQVVVHSCKVDKPEPPKTKKVKKNADK